MLFFKVLFGQKYIQIIFFLLFFDINISKRYEKHKKIILSNFLKFFNKTLFGMQFQTILKKIKISQQKKV